MRGKLIVIYAVNNLGKTLQAKLVEDKIRKLGLLAEYLKYPICDLEVSGPTIAKYLHKEVPEGQAYFEVSKENLQVVYTINRLQYEPTLIKKLEAGINMVVEDYTHTGTAWGVAYNPEDRDFLERLNAYQLKPDIVILLDGERFRSGIEVGHTHEENDGLINNCRAEFLHMAMENNWPIINANQTVEDVHKDIWTQIAPLFT